MGGGSDFTHNLGLLCSYQRSIAEICRKLGFNRQQFNKYLAGSVMPSRPQHAADLRFLRRDGIRTAVAGR
jgi:hypothetical protein